MGWRDKMGGDGALEHSRSLEQKEQKEQKVDDRGAFATSATIALRVENKKSGYPIPDTEPEFALDERQAIIAVDGGQDIPYSGPVEVKMDSAILGATVDVSLEPNHATVGGVFYSKAELVDLKTRSLSAATLRTVHEAKQAFDGVVVQGGM